MFLSLVEESMCAKGFKLCSSSPLTTLLAIVPGDLGKRKCYKVKDGLGRS